ncbi:MAG: permease prefix domain 1-containing protein [Candidatus Hydrogenedentes bacterium]|nr:permease prefix domain 1-containing protein [Candidatus Hydrogenedentota bacterium]
MDQLRVHVERIVRPIRATAGRKNKMREELLAHLMQKAEALMAKGADEATACAQAIEQLGGPAALRADLQATVPALERLACLPLPASPFLDRYFEKDEGETPLHFALVRTSHMALAIGAILLVAATVRWSGLFPFRQRNANPRAYCLIMMSFSYLSVVVSSFVCYYFADVTGLRRLMSKVAPGPAWVKGGALCLFMTAEIVLMIAPIMLFVWIINPADGGILVDVFSGEFGRRFGIGILLVLLVASVISGLAMKYEHEQWRKWGSLHVDD